MKLLPYEKYTLSTPLTIPEARQRLAGQLEFKWSGFYNSKKETKPYWGKLSDDRFFISRIIRYRNSFLPIITGHFSDTDGKTTIAIGMRLEIPVLVFMTLLLGVAGVLCITVAYSAIDNTLHHPKQHSPAIWGPLMMFALGYGIMIVPFKYETAKSKKFLADLFKAE